jgi:hypothetical protein
VPELLEDEDDEVLDDEVLDDEVLDDEVLDDEVLELLDDPELVVLEDELPDEEVLDEDDVLLVEAIVPPVPLEDVDELDAAPPEPVAPVPHMHTP